MGTQLIVAFSALGAVLVSLTTALLAWRSDRRKASKDETALLYDETRALRTENQELRGKHLEMNGLIIDLRDRLQQVESENRSLGEKLVEMTEDRDYWRRRFGEGRQP